MIDNKRTDSFANRLKAALEEKHLTAAEVAKRTGLSKAQLSQYTNGVYEAKQRAVYLLAQALNVSEAWLMGYDVPMEKKPLEATLLEKGKIFPIETQQVPLVGTIAAGEPIFAEEDFECYIELGSRIRCDYCLRVKGDSMINARIYDGDIVFIHKQPDVEDGEIAAVLVDDEATLKRVYKSGDAIMLVAENPNYKPITVTASDYANVIILGKAVAFQGGIK